MNELTPRAQAEKHLFTLFHGQLAAGEWYELRALDCSQEPAAQGPRSFHRSLMALIDEGVKLREQWDVFFGVGIRRCPTTTDIRRCPHSTRGADHVSRLPAAWADIDIACEDEPDKPHESIDAALTMLDNQQPAPGLVIGSGVGLHAYWLLSSLSNDLERIAALNRGIRDRLHGDNAIDPARILRLAGTFNHKHGSPLPVTLLRNGARP